MTSMSLEGQECVPIRSVLDCVAFNKFFASLSLSFPVCNVKIAKLIPRSPSSISPDGYKRVPEYSLQQDHQRHHGIPLCHPSTLGGK